MSATDPKLYLLRESMLQDLLAHNTPTADIARILGITPPGVSVMLGRLRKPRKPTASEKRLRARIREYVRKNGHIKVTVSTEDL